MNQEMLGVSPINWINDDMEDLGDFYDLETVLQDMQNLGFRGTEMGRKYPRDVAALKPLLARFGLVLSGAWKTVQFSSGWNSQVDFADFQRHVQFLQAMGAHYAVVCDGGGSLHWDARGPRAEIEPFDDEAWQRLGEGLHRAGEYALQYGVNIVYHPHVGTNVERPDAIDRLMELTDPSLVSLLLDTGHIYAGGGVPQDIIRRHGPRIRYLHLKDVRPRVLEMMRRQNWSFIAAVRQGLFTTPGDGCIDFPAVFQAMSEVGYQGWMILEAEQDPLQAEPVAYARTAKTYLSSLMNLVEATGGDDQRV